MAFLALFSMVFQSSMLVREKIKLQQSVDYAALTGAQIQRAALDKIHALNEDILEKFYATQSALIPSSFIAFSGSNPVSTSAIVFSITNDPGANTGCGGAAQALDKFVRKKIVRAYETYRGQRVDQIMDIIENTNGLSHEHVVSQIIHTPNLPQRLRHQVIKAMGQDPNIDSLQASYQNGLIHDHLRVTSTGDMELPLFIPSSLNPANDMTAFTYPTYSSQAITAAYVQVCSFPFPSGIDVSPTKTIVGRHPASDKSWPSHFAVMAMYDPPSSTVEGKFNLKVKNPNAADEGNVSLAGGEDIDLMPRFDSQSPRRWPMLVASLAKPFGGKFPKAPLQALPHGNPGETFDGAKLIGFADYQRQLEGHTPIIPLLQEISDKYGITVEWDDIWH
ncbi:MAG TPA: hypothetical protein PKC21_09155 [Oligoflexia bacterium]|nr:hypothetical protein [Oligoflexia bacterium]HMR25505.1 hypothetical protein [Oligoflexia bacterium]